MVRGDGSRLRVYHPPAPSPAPAAANAADSTKPSPVAVAAALDVLEAAVRRSFADLENAHRRSRKRQAVAAATLARVAKGRKAGSKGTGSTAASLTADAPAASNAASGAAVVPPGFLTTRQAMEALLATELGAGKAAALVAADAASSAAPSAATGKGGARKRGGRAAAAADAEPPSDAPAHAPSAPAEAKPALFDATPPPGTLAASPLLPHLAYWSPYAAHVDSSHAAPGVAPASVPRPFVFFTAPRDSRHVVSLSWALPPLLGWYWSKPEHVLGELLGHEARGTVLALLKARSWGNEIEAGLDRRQGSACSSVASVLTVDVDATAEGVRHWREVVGIVCSYVVHVLCGGIAVAAAGTSASSTAAASGRPVLAVADGGAAAESPSAPSPGASGGGSGGRKRRRGASNASNGGDGRYRGAAAAAASTSDAVSSSGGFPLPCEGLVTIHGTPVPAATLGALTAHAAGLAWAHEEVAALEAAGYHHSDEDEEPLDVATALAAGMVTGAADGGVLQAPSGMLGRFCPPAVAVLLAHLVPAGMRVDVCSPLVAGMPQLPPAPAPAAAGGGGSSGGAGKGAGAAPPSSASSAAATTDAPLTLTAAETATVTPGVEPWFTIPYLRVAADPAAAAAWANPPPTPGLALPPRNPFVPTDFTVKPLEAAAEGAAASDGAPVGDDADAAVAALVASGAIQPPPPHLTSVPREVACEALRYTGGGGGGGGSSVDAAPLLLLGRLWHKQADGFRVPVTDVRAQLHLPVLYTEPSGAAAASAAGGGGAPAPAAFTPPHLLPANGAGVELASVAPHPSLTAAAALSTMHAYVASDDLNETLYQAELAKVEGSVKCARTGYRLRVSGFSHRLPDVLAAMASRLAAPSGVPRAGDGGGDAEEEGAGVAAAPSSSSSAPDATPEGRQFARLATAYARGLASGNLDPLSKAAHGLAGLLATGAGVDAAVDVTSGGSSVGGGAACALPPYDATAAVQASLSEEAQLALLGPEGAGVRLEQLRAFTGGDGSSGGSGSSAGAPAHQLWSPVRFTGSGGSSGAGSATYRPVILEVLVHGNETAATATGLYRAMFAAVADAVRRAHGGDNCAYTVAPVPPSQVAGLDALYPPAPTVALPAGSDSRLALPSVSPLEANNAVDVYYQVGHGADGDDDGGSDGGASAVSSSSAPLRRAPAALAGPPPFSYHVARARLKLLQELLSEPLFDGLRTRAQLGYTVGSSSRGVEARVTSLHLHVVSSSHTPADVAARVDEWLAGFRARLATMDDPPAAPEAAAAAEGGGKRAGSGKGAGAASAPPPPASQSQQQTPFARHRASLIESCLMRDDSLGQETDRHWEEVRTRRRAFRRLTAEVAALAAKCTLADVLALYDAAVLNPATRRRVVVQVAGQASTAGSGGAGAGASGK